MNDYKKKYLKYKLKYLNLKQQSGGDFLPEEARIANNLFSDGRITNPFNEEEYISNYYGNPRGNCIADVYNDENFIKNVIEPIGVGVVGKKWDKLDLSKSKLEEMCKVGKYEPGKVEPECSINDSITYMKELIKEDKKHCEQNDKNKEAYYRKAPSDVCLYEDIHKEKEVINECQEAAEQQQKQEPELSKKEPEQEPELSKEEKKKIRPCVERKTMENAVANARLNPEDQKKTKEELEAENKNIEKECKKELESKSEKVVTEKNNLSSLKEEQKSYECFKIESKNTCDEEKYKDEDYCKKDEGLCRIDNGCITYKLLKDTEEKCKLTNFELNK